MKYLLDSNIIIDYLKGRIEAVDILESIQEEELYCSIISWMEIFYGVKNSKSENSKKEKQLKAFFSELEIELIPLNSLVAEKYIDLRIQLENEGKKIADFDLLIASTAVQMNLVLITRNLKHFKRIPSIKIYQ